MPSSSSSHLGSKTTVWRLPHTLALFGGVFSGSQSWMSTPWGRPLAAVVSSQSVACGLAGKARTTAEPSLAREAGSAVPSPQVPASGSSHMFQVYMAPSPRPLPGPQLSGHLPLPPPGLIAPFLEENSGAPWDAPTGSSSLYCPPVSFWAAPSPPLSTYCFLATQACHPLRNALSSPGFRPLLTPCPLLRRPSPVSAWKSHPSQLSGPLLRSYPKLPGCPLALPASVCGPWSHAGPFGENL